eukprot:TRINITY_DN21727_c0_g1_i1.p1 TRINITY_DN21727_c0_g1~~TRINITY_DN21727_c0_g1_i1.p1  ORF type:complete len:193 (+),score=50.43 TRINITY_DN21727_c0_g1_i1:71-649(+)
MGDNPMEVEFGDLGSRPRYGRRSNQPETIAPAADTDLTQPTTRKGWGFDSEADVGNRSSSPAPQMIDSFPAQAGDEELMEVDRRGDKGDDEGGQAIPQLENDGDEDITQQIADAPRNYEGLKVPLLSELEQEGHFPLPSTTEDIDITVLTSVLSPSVDEEDVEWEPNTLFSQLASEIQAERDAASSEEKTGQ